MRNCAAESSSSLKRLLQGYANPNCRSTWTECADRRAKALTLLSPRGSRLGWASLFAVLEAPTVVAGLDDVAVLGEATEERRGHLAVAEYGGPVGEGRI